MIIFTQEDAVAQVAALIDNYPGLGVLASNSETIRLQGSIRVYRTAFDYTLDRSYIVEIIIPVNSSTLPIERIDVDRNYHLTIHFFVTTEDFEMKSTAANATIRESDCCIQTRVG